MVNAARDGEEQGDMNVALFAEERRGQILDRSRADGRVESGGLAGDFRPDLALLGRRGLPRRVHGGAVPIENLHHVASHGARNEQLLTEKLQIARAALAFLPSKGAIADHAYQLTSNRTDAD